MQKQNRKPGIHLHKTAHKHVSTGKYCEYYWILIAKNGKTIAKSSETYKTKGSAVKSIKIASDVFRFVSPSAFYDNTGKEVKQVVY